MERREGGSAKILITLLLFVALALIGQVAFKLFRGEVFGL